MNIQCYWDGNTGACEYEARKHVYTSKPVIPNVNFNILAYSEDDHIASKVLLGTTYVLTPEEIQAVKEFANANAIDNSAVGDALLEEHNVDPNAHHDMRVELSELSRLAHKVCTVWTTEDLCSNQNAEDATNRLHWKHVLFDLQDCTVSTDDRFWKCPITELYDISITVGYDGVSDGTHTVTLELYKNDTKVKTFTKAGIKGTNFVVRADVNGLQLNAGDTLSVKACGVLDGVIVPYRTFLTVDNNGSEMAKRGRDAYLNTISALLFVKGYSAMISKDSSSKPSVIAGTWNHVPIVLPELA